MGREEHCKQISLSCVRSAHSVWATLGLPPFMACVLSWSTLLKLQVALQWNCLKWALGCWHFPALSRSGSGSRVLHKGAQIQLGLRFVPFPGPCSSGDQVFGECVCRNLSPPLSLPLGFLGVQPVHLLRRMLTVQNPKKSWLAMKPACSLVDNASLGPRFTPSSSGCLSPEEDGLQPTSSLQSFVL